MCAALRPSAIRVCTSPLRPLKTGLPEGGRHCARHFQEQTNSRCIAKIHLRSRVVEQRPDVHCSQPACSAHAARPCHPTRSLFFCSVDASNQWTFNLNNTACATQPTLLYFVWAFRWMRCNSSPKVTQSIQRPCKQSRQQQATHRSGSGLSLLNHMGPCSFNFNGRFPVHPQEKYPDLMPLQCQPRIVK